MTDKELIKQEIERLHELLPVMDGDNVSINYAERICTALEKYIDSIPEEPASEDLEEEVHKHLLNIGATIEMYSGNVMGLDLCEDDYVDFARHFAEWQKNKMKEALQTEYEKGRFDMQQEMMKNTVETVIVNDWQYGKDPDRAIIPAIHQRIEGFNVGDKVKIIIVKEN